MNDLYPETYGRYRHPADRSKCCASVYSGSIMTGSKQCQRPSGHGPEQAYCKQHDPIARKAKDEKRQEQWAKKWDAEKKARHLSWFSSEFLKALEAIEAGHNDPHALAVEVLERFRK